MAGAIDLLALAWGDKSGYVFLSTLDRSKDKKDPGYWVDLPFKWPDERPRIEKTLENAKTAKREVYWAPAVYKSARRKKEQVEEVTTLWADLDDVSPDDLPKYLKPTAVVESSPGRYQAIWQLSDPLSPDQQQPLNQRLSYAVGADRGGWDLTQVLRIPDTLNHKYPDEPVVKLTSLNGAVVDPKRLTRRLPPAEVVVAHEAEFDDLPDALEVLRKKSRKIKGRAKALLRATHAPPHTRSERLWELECLLAESGLNAKEIVSVVRGTVWNKFRNRHDEVKRLSTEANKAIAHAAEQEDDPDEDAIEVASLTSDEAQVLTWADFDADHQPIRWLVADIWGEGEVGFISGLPKSYKSWISLDFAVSVATGTRFLGSFQARRHNVLLIQEEDPRVVLQDRLAKVGAAKDLIWVGEEDGIISMRYELPDNLYIISNQGFTINEEWLSWLEQRIIDLDIQLIVMDPLMMIAEGFDEFKAFEMMTSVLKPLKRLRARTSTAIAVVHHHIKNSGKEGAVAMYGSVALWAWEEAALHLNITGVGRVVAERFSKHSLLSPLTIETGDLDKGWNPDVSSGVGNQILLDLLTTLEGGATLEEMSRVTDLGRDALQRQLKQLEEKGKVERAGTRGTGPGRKKIVWRAVTGGQGQKG